jgi:hypothetical protein
MKKEKEMFGNEVSLMQGSTFYGVFSFSFSQQANSTMHQLLRGPPISLFPFYFSSLNISSVHELVRNALGP